MAHEALHQFANWQPMASSARAPCTGQQGVTCGLLSISQSGRRLKHVLVRAAAAVCMVSLLSTTPVASSGASHSQRNVDDDKRGQARRFGFATGQLNGGTAEKLQHQAPGQVKKPHIVFVLWDDFGWTGAG